MGSSPNRDGRTPISHDFVDSGALTEGSQQAILDTSSTNRPKQAHLGNSKKKSLLLGKNPHRNDAIRQTALALQQNNLDPHGLDQLVDAVCTALERGPSRRRKIGSKGLGKRSGALLRTYAPQLDAELAAKIRERCRERFTEILGRLDTGTRHPMVPQHQAALTLGIGVADLRDLIKNPDVRRSLGWPRPIGGHVLFAQAALDPATAESHLKSIPETEPWPRHSWPEGWR